MPAVMSSPNPPPPMKAASVAADTICTAAVRIPAKMSGSASGISMRRIRIPLALPVIFAGIRTAAVQIVSAATLAAFIGGGGLGELITAGMGTLNIAELVLGGVAVAALAVATELTFAGLEWSVRRSTGAAA